MSRSRHHMEIFELLFLVFVLGEELCTEIVIPDLSAISFIELQILLIISISVLFSLILTFGILCIIEILSSFKTFLYCFLYINRIKRGSFTSLRFLIYIKKRKSGNSLYSACHNCISCFYSFLHSPSIQTTCNRRLHHCGNDNKSIRIQVRSFFRDYKISFLN